MNLLHKSPTMSELLKQYEQFLEEKKPKEVERSSQTEPIVGLRVWNLITEGSLPKLRSTYKTTTWPYRKAMERDPIHDKGIHAVKTGEQILQTFMAYQAQVAGEVYLWGKVEEHESGYLADFAYPKRLFVPESFDPIALMQLEDEYGVPGEFRSEFSATWAERAIPNNPYGLAQSDYYRICQQLMQAHAQSMVYGVGLGRILP